MILASCQMIPKLSRFKLCLLCKQLILEQAVNNLGIIFDSFLTSVFFLFQTNDTQKKNSELMTEFKPTNIRTPVGSSIH